MTARTLMLMQKRAFSSSPWHALLSALDGVSDEAFTWQPERHRGFPWMNGSIQDIVYHLTGDKLVQLDHAFGEGRLNWDNVQLQKTDKLRMIEDLREADAKVASCLAAISDEGLSQRVSSWGGKTMLASDFFIMLIEHDLYHAGQIRYIRNVAETND